MAHNLTYTVCMSKADFERLKRVIAGYSQAKYLAEFMLSDKYDGPPFPAIIRASTEGCLADANDNLEQAWDQIAKALDLT